MHADKKSGRQVARHSDRQVDRQTDRLTDSGFIYKERETILNRQVHRDENRNTHTYTDTDTQTVEEEVICTQRPIMTLRRMGLSEGGWTERPMHLFV